MGADMNRSSQHEQTTFVHVMLRFMNCASGASQCEPYLSNEHSSGLDQRWRVAQHALLDIHDVAEILGLQTTSQSVQA